VIAILSLFLFFCCLNYTKKIIRKEFKPSDFSIFNKHRNEQLPEI
jgi:hypothetical protein